MEVNSVTRSLNLPPSPAVPSHTVAAEEVQAKAVEATKVTPPPNSSDAAPQGGNPGQPGLGDHVDIYDTEAAKKAAEKGAQSAAQDQVSPAPEIAAETKPAKKLHLLGKGEGLPDPVDLPPEPEFPFLSPLGNRPAGKPSDPHPGQVFDAKV